jgi:uncharacterized protein
VTNACIETFTGHWFDILDPQSDQIDIESISHSLSMLCRFTGHVRHFYSVGQHSWLGSYLVPEEDALEFLLHDASEAFIGDMNRPLKHMTAAGGPYREVEAKIMQAIRRKFGLPLTQSESIHRVDNEMLYAEKAQLMSPLAWTQASREGCECPDTTAANVVIHEMTPREVEEVFLERFTQLRRIK